MGSVERRSRALSALFADVVIALGSVGCAEAAPSTLPIAEPEATAPRASSARTDAPASGPRPTSHVVERVPPKEIGGVCDMGVSGQTKVGADAANLVFGLSPKEPVDYVELVLFENRVAGKTLMAAGRKCASAKDWRTCEDEVARAAPPEGQYGFMHGCIPGACAHGLVVTKGDDVAVYAKPDDVVRFLAPIDTPSEALLVAFANEYSPGGDYYAKCELVQGKGLSKPANGGYELTATKMISSCPITTSTVKLRVTADGSVVEMAQLGKSAPGPCAGRRPPGYRRARSASREAVDPVGAYLAELAELEAASIGAFEILARELGEAGAPSELVRTAIRSKRDEVRHARGATNLARRYGATQATPREPATCTRSARRSLATMARENEIEGCIREAYGALVATYQAKHAADPRARAFFRTIARDEMRHFALALELRGFFRSRLSARAWRGVVRARAHAIAELGAAQATPVDPRLRAIAGLPPPEVAAALVRELARVVMSEEGEAASTV